MFTELGAEIAQELDEDYFMEWMNILGEHLQKRLDARVVKIYYNKLKILTEEQFMSAIDNAITNGKQFEFPSTEKMLEYAIGNREQRAQAKLAYRQPDLPALPGAGYAPIDLPAGGVLRPAGCPPGNDLREWHLGRLRCAVDVARYTKQPEKLTAIRAEVEKPGGEVATLGIVWDDVKSGFAG